MTLSIARFKSKSLLGQLYAEILTIDLTVLLFHSLKTPHAVIITNERWLELLSFLVHGSYAQGLDSLLDFDVQRFVEDPRLSLILLPINESIHLFYHLIEPFHHSAVKCLVWLHGELLSTQQTIIELLVGRTNPPVSVLFVLLGLRLCSFSHWWWRGWDFAWIEALTSLLLQSLYKTCHLGVGRIHVGLVGLYGCQVAQALLYDQLV